MSSRLSTIWGLVSHYKYLIVVVIGIAVVGFLDDNSFMKRIRMELQISDMKDEIQKYNTQNASDSRQLRELKRNPKAIEKIARERYFMKADDEDIYVLSDDEKPEETNNETTE
jgi:cell division protein DivIC